MRYRSLRRVLPYLRPYRVALVIVAGVALVGLVAAVAIPLVTKAVIDGPLTDGDREGIAALAGLALVLGIVEAVATFVRRNVLGVVAHGVETALRNDLYAQLQRLDVGFHDDWDSGQLLSRATSDISAIRRFVGWGAIFFVINGVTAVVVLVLLARLNAPLAFMVVVMAVPLVFILRVLQRRYSEASRKVQDDTGDLATHVEEGATGIRAIKSFGRRRFVNERFDNASAGAARLVDGARQAHHPLRVGPERACPASRSPRCCSSARSRSATESMTLGGLVAFVSYLLMVIWPIESLGWILGMAEEAATAAERVFEVFDSEPRVATKPGRSNSATSQGV